MNYTFQKIIVFDRNLYKNELLSLPVFTTRILFEIEIPYHTNCDAILFDNSIQLNRIYLLAHLLSELTEFLGENKQISQFFNFMQSRRF